MRQTAKDLRAALALLERDGWQQKSFGPSDPRVQEPRCAGGACMAATPTLARVALACRALRHALPPSASKVTNYNDSIEAYNDYPGQRFSAIKRLFERAIVAEEADG